MGLGTQTIAPSFKTYFLAFSLSLKSVRGAKMEKNQSSGASRQTDSHALAKIGHFRCKINGRDTEEGKIQDNANLAWEGSL